MAKSTINLSNGTVITIEGTMEEVAGLIRLYGTTSGPAPRGKNKRSRKNAGVEESKTNTIDLLEIVSATKDDNDFDKIESQILDKASQVDRVLLPLFVSERAFLNPPALTTKDIYQFLKQFGIYMALPNVSKTLSTKAVKYVMPTKLKKRGSGNSYRLSRKGQQYMEQVLAR